MKIGDLIKTNFSDEKNSTGVVLNIRKDVEFPLLVEVLWDNGYISSVHCVILETIEENAPN
ncbi:MAG: hypothetical protein CL885_04495 [Dehalococcoidia bacterium]|nr:hypothetical protein [Dehalococcoidia bacterium]